MATIFYEHDANPNALKGKTIAILGYGSQGHAQAQNLARQRLQSNRRAGAESPQRAAGPRRWHGCRCSR